MEENLNIYQKLAKIRSIADVVAKGKKGYNYTYADITEILAKVTAGEKKYGVSLIPSIVPGTSVVEQNVITEQKVDKTGKPFTKTTTEMLYSADMIFTWVNDDNPNERIDVSWHITGSQTDPSQALGSSLTYCTRYFLTSYFQIAQPDTDVDEYRSKQKEASDAEDKAIATELVGQIDKLVRDFLSDNKDKEADVKEFMGRYAKSSNYLNIKDPVLASKLLGDFKNTFIKGDE